MYSLIQHVTLGIIFLCIAHSLMNILKVHKHTRPFIELLVWSAVIWFIASGLWSPLM